MNPPSKIHLIERAAEQLLRTGSAPDIAGGMPGGTEAVSSQPSPPQANGHPAPAWQRNATSVPLGALTSAGLIENGSGRRRVNEEFRLVQSQLVRAAFATEGGEAGFSNLLMVTSAKPQEGKTFAALNLAAGIARQGDHQVLLLDADIKQGSLSDTLGMGNAPGLLDLATAPAEDPTTLVRNTDLATLSIMPVGDQRRGELLASEQTIRALQALGRRFPDRLIIIDVSPCLSTSDPSALAPYVGQTVFVIEAERTQREEVEAALDLIQACPSITLLLNKIRMSTPRSFGAYAYAYNS